MHENRGSDAGHCTFKRTFFLELMVGGWAVLLLGEEEEDGDR